MASVGKEGICANILCKGKKLAKTKKGDVNDRMMR
jgi:hypothetical protein